MVLEEERGGQREPNPGRRREGSVILPIFSIVTGSSEQRVGRKQNGVT